jgi:hypothetical protein
MYMFGDGHMHDCVFTCLACYTYLVYRAFIFHSICELSGVSP